MAILKTDYKDDILDTSQNTKRKYAMSENQDDTVSFDDETEYLQEGDSFGAQDINATNAQVNTNTGAIADINDNLAQTPITVGGETLSTIDDKLNFLVGNIISILDREICNVFIIAGAGGSTNGSCVRKTDGTVVNGASATVTTEDFIIENYGTIKANKAGKYLIFGAYNNNQYVPSISIVDVNANDTLVNYQQNGQRAHTISVIIRLD